ncbi:protein PHYTOCHROME-DEPENDENT LATE-FLOWERING-like [Humulus lupulus]|uniref:protein PHYTOCHROME-DEPENDENT LATE-FLOWERING-like n=1 Tax=Humulus lupulus TaxID=3486 RepID=UPI002B40A6B9|nr:protein PHYTOCHROME-DEPENDENT LATE-FLOWERING-like [Humulus lupulus]
MGISFKVAKMGTRYKPKLVQIEDEDDGNGSPHSQSSVNQQGNFSEVRNKFSDLSSGVAKNTLPHSASDDIEVSFLLNLFPNGFSLGKVNESFKIAPEQLYPYNRSTKTLFSAIEYGWLPGDIFGDLPCKYFNGCVLCEIHDYRNCLLHKGGSSIQKSPIVYRVILQMCMENVVKDIMSISDDSWTYNDLLEVESRIVKALQPNLCLNPQPLMGIQHGETLTKKINLDISWSWKKSKQCNAAATTNQISTDDLCHVTRTPDNSACQNSNYLCGLVHQDRGVVLAKKDIPTPIRYTQHNILGKTKSQLYPLTSHQNFQLGKTRVPSTLVNLSTSNSSLSKRSSMKRTIDKTKLTSSNLNVNEVSQNQAIQEPLLKKPKEEPVDFSYQQFLGKSIITSATPQLPWQNAVMHQKIDAENILPARFQDKVCPSQLIKNCLALSSGGILNPEVGSATSTVKQEPVDTCLPRLDFANMKDRRVNLSDGLQFQDQQSLNSLKKNYRIENSLKKPIVQVIDKHGKKEKNSSRRKVLENLQLIYDGSTPRNSQNVESWATEAFTPLKRKGTPDNNFSINLFDPNANRNNVNIANANRISVGINPLSHTLEIEDNIILERLSKIKEVTQRCKLIKKPKLDQQLVNKENFHATEMVAFHLSKCDDSRNSEATRGDQVSLSQLSMGTSNVSYARILMFVREQSAVFQGNGIRFYGGEVHVRLELAQEFNKITVEANVLYGSKYETAPIVLSPLPSFPSAHSAERFISQFSCLMSHEGYSLAYDRVVPNYPETEGRQQCNSAVKQPSGTFEPPCKPKSNPNPNPKSNPNAMTASMSQHNSSQLLSKQNFPEGQLRPTKNVRSSPQITLPKLDLEFTAQFTSMTLQIQEMIIKRAQLQHQIQERQRHQELLMQRKAVLGVPATTAGCLGTLQLAPTNGIQRDRNFSFCSFGNVTNPMASSSKIYGGGLPCSSSLGLNDSKHRLASTPDYFSALSSNRRAADGQWSGLEGGVPSYRNDILVPRSSPSPKVEETQPILSHMHQQAKQLQRLSMLQQQERRLLIENLESICLAQQQIGSSPSQLSPDTNFGQLVGSYSSGLNSQQLSQFLQTNQRSLESVNFGQQVQQFAQLLQTNQGSLESINFGQQGGSSSSALNSQQFARPPQTTQQRQQKPEPVPEVMRKKNTKLPRGRVERGRKMHGAMGGSNI